MNQPLNVETSLHGRVAEVLARAGWSGTGDTPTLQLREVLAQLQAVLLPSPIPAGGPVYPVDHQVAHTCAIVATDGLPEGPGKELAYLRATAQLGAGMGLRDHFAGLALPPLLQLQVTQVWNDAIGGTSRGTALMVARTCYHVADAMLAAREIQP